MGQEESAPGWYADPSGRSGEVRYWNGRAWSDLTRPAGFGGHPKHRGPLIALLAGVVAVIVVAVLIVVHPGRRPAATPPVPTPAASSGGIAAGELCSEPSPVAEEQVPTPNGRVSSGRLGYPALGSPFASPTRTTLMRFGYLRDVASQFAVLRYQGSSTGGAEVMVARLPLIDGLSRVDQVGKVLFGCVRDRFPGADERGRTQRTTTIDRHPAWMVRTHLGYGAPTAGVRGGVIIVCVIATADGENGLFYAYLPDTHPELVPRVEAAFAKLTVG